jgi:polysaccharide pyruvyl transferase WcaK-like protein
MSGVDVIQYADAVEGKRKKPEGKGRQHESRIALLTPYNGGNLGDAAIQDALIANLRLRLPGVQFSGISLNNRKFVEQHGSASFPLCVSDRPSYAMEWENVPGSYEMKMKVGPSSAQQGASSSKSLKQALKQVPVLGWCLKRAFSLGRLVSREVRHCAQGYRFLRTHDLLIVSGGGQLDEEWGGAWGHPFALFKWGVLARMARIPYVIASVGACKVDSTTCRFFLSAALRMASYTSFRDEKSREVASGLLARAAEDPIVPDLAFSVPPSEFPPPADIRSISQGRTVVAISPIAYYKPGSWPNEDSALYRQYVQKMAQIVLKLLERGCFPVIVYSSIGDDDRVIPDILGSIGEESRTRFAQQMHIPAIRTWKDLVAVLRDADYLIASRLHSAILGFATHTPTIAISFDPKVDWVMEDLGQTDYLLQIRNFAAGNVIEALDRIEARADGVAEQIGSYQRRILAALALQYDALAEFVLGSSAT